MRTTVDLPPDLLVEAKERAAREGRSLSEVVSDAVRSSFARTTSTGRQPVRLPTFSGGGACSLEWTSTTAPPFSDVMERGD